MVDVHLARLQEFARYIITHIYASVLGNREVLTNESFISSLKLRETLFDPEEMRLAYAPHAGSVEMHKWNLNPFALEKYIVDRTAADGSGELAGVQAAAQSQK